MSAPILKAVKKGDQIPPLPAVAAEMLRMLRSGDSAIDPLVEIVRLDPVLTARVLKIAHTALFEAQGTASSLRQAIMLVGPKMAQVLVVGLATIDLFQEGDVFDREAYWRRSLTTATVARLLAEAAGGGEVDEAFVCGLLADLGMLAAWRSSPKLYYPVISDRRKRPRPLVQVEKDWLNVAHPEISRELLYLWGIPENLCAAIGTHHGEGFAFLRSSEKALAKILYSAASMADLFCGEVPVGDAREIKSRILQQLELREEEFDAAMEYVVGYVHEIASGLSLSIGLVSEYREWSDAPSQVASGTRRGEGRRSTGGVSVPGTEKNATASRTALHDSQVDILSKKIEEFEKRVQVAASHQRRMLPKIPTDIPGVEVGVLYRPAEDISGDLYDFVHLADGAWAFLIGDVSGHGIEAGILMGMAQKTLGERLRKYNDPQEALCSANEDFCRDLDRRCFLTVCVVVYYPEDRNLKVVRAGHNSPLLFNPDGVPPSMPLKPGGLGLGLQAGKIFAQTLEVQEQPVFPNDALLLYTDGIPETMNPEGEEFGEERIGEMLKTISQRGVPRFLAEITTELSKFRAGGLQEDDVSALVIRFT